MGVQEGAAGGGLLGEPGFCLVVGPCDPAYLLRTERGWCGAMFTVILSLSNQ